MIGLLILVCNFNFQEVKATDSFVIHWIKTYPTVNQSASCVVQTKTGGYAVAGARAGMKRGREVCFSTQTQMVIKSGIELMIQIIRTF